jgi:hypothetical protein
MIRLFWNFQWNKMSIFEEYSIERFHPFSSLRSSSLSQPFPPHRFEIRHCDDTVTKMAAATFFVRFVIDE